jgi:hypothetical protein
MYIGFLCHKTKKDHSYREHRIRLRNRKHGFESRQGKKVFRENIAVLLCTIDLICIVCVLKMRKKASAQLSFFNVLMVTSKYFYQ